MSEIKISSTAATGKRPGTSFSPGPTSLESNFRSVRPISALPNRSGNRGESQFNQTVRADTLKQFTPKEVNKITSTSSKPIEATPQRGRDRFAALGNTKEYRIGHQIDPLERTIPRTEVSRMVKVAETAAPKPAPTEVRALAIPKAPESSSAKPQEPSIRRVVVSADNIMQPPTEAPKQTNGLPFTRTIDLQPISAASRYNQKTEVSARMNAQVKTAEFPVTFSGGTQSKAAEIITPTKASRIANIIREQKLDLQDALKIEPITKSKRTSVAELLKSNASSAAGLLDLVKDTPPTRVSANGKSEMSKPSIRIDQLIDQIKKGESKGNQRADVRTALALNIAEQNAKVVKDVMRVDNPQASAAISPDVARKIVSEQGVIDFQKARELIIQNRTEQKPGISTKPENVREAVVALEQSKIKTQTESNTAPDTEPTRELPAHLQAVIEVVSNPEQIAFHPQKRAEALQLLSEIADTKEYAANPALQTQLKQALRAQQEKVVEEQAVAKTVEQMMIAGFDQEVIVQNLQVVIEQKKLPIDEAQMTQILERAQARVTQGPRLIAENGVQIEDKEDEYQQMIRQIQELMVQLDQKALEKRFKTMFETLEKIWVIALEQGWTKIDFAQYIELLPEEEPEEEVSEILKPKELYSIPIEEKRTDGSRVEAIKEIRSLGSFDNLDIARQTLTNVLLNHLPGQLTTKVTTQQLNSQQVKEILQGGAYPTQMGNGVRIYDIAA